MKKQKSLNLKNQNGISLVEVVLVLLIIGSLILLINNLPPSLNLVGASRHESIAKEITTKETEDLRSATFDNLANGVSHISDPRLSSLPAGSSQVTISNCPSSICTNSEQVKQIDIQISWNENGKTKQFNTSTLISKGGLR